LQFHKKLDFSRKGTAHAGKWQKVLRNEIILPEEWTFKNHKIYSREMVAFEEFFM